MAQTDLNSFLADFSEVTDLSAGWKLLCAELTRFGFDRVLYARKPKADLRNFHNRFRITAFSTYGEAADRLLLELGGYVVDHSIRWAVENAGAISWRINRERYLAGLMTAQEESIHLSMREAGVIAGLTYGNPVLPHQVRSGFGLCALAGLPQDEVDQIWAQDGAEIAAYLQVFELAASAFQNIPVDADLTDRQREILRLTVDGKTVEEMATLLRVHRRTIETHLAAARNKLGVATTLQAAVIATQQGQL